MLNDYPVYLYMYICIYVYLSLFHFIVDENFDQTDQGTFINDGFTKERSVDQALHDSEVGKMNGKPHPATNGNADVITSSFVNQAFDNDDISDEDLDSAMAQPNAHRPRTLRECLSLSLGLHQELMFFPHN